MGLEWRTASSIYTVKLLEHDINNHDDEKAHKYYLNPMSRKISSNKRKSKEKLCPIN